MMKLKLNGHMVVQKRLAVIRNKNNQNQNVAIKNKSVKLTKKYMIARLNFD